MISYQDFSNLCNKYNFIKVRCTAGIDFVGFYLEENHRSFYTIGMYGISDCWIYNVIGFNYFVSESERTLCNSIEDLEKGLKNAILLKKKFIIKNKIDEIEKEFK